MALLTLALFAMPCSAVEGGLGRSITGMQIAPFAGIVPPEPGFIWSVALIDYGGEFDADVQTPISGTLAVGLEADFFLAALNGVYVWDTPGKRWNFASVVVLPYAFVGANATVVTNQAQVGVDDDVSDFFDMTIVPVLASYHVSPLEHWSLGLYIAPPSGPYETGELANTSLNYWTFSPTVGYTKLFAKGEIEFSSQAAIDFNTENEDTDYQSGDIFRLEALFMRRLPNGWGFGAIGGWIYQFSDDEGAPIADTLDGFRGRALSIGPALSYKHAAGDGELDFNFRWQHEFSVENRFEGDGLSATLTFNF